MGGFVSARGYPLSITLNHGIESVTYHLIPYGIKVLYTMTDIARKTRAEGRAEAHTV
jgi:hypothetical protein